MKKEEFQAKRNRLKTKALKVKNHYTKNPPKHRRYSYPLTPEFSYDTMNDDLKKGLPPSVSRYAKHKDIRYLQNKS